MAISKALLKALGGTRVSSIGSPRYRIDGRVISETKARSIALEKGIAPNTIGASKAATKAGRASAVKAPVNKDVNRRAILSGQVRKDIVTMTTRDIPKLRRKLQGTNRQLDKAQRKMAELTKAKAPDTVFKMAFFQASKADVKKKIPELLKRQAQLTRKLDNTERMIQQFKRQYLRLNNRG